jgi:hypothetical protein
MEETGHLGHTGQLTFDVGEAGEEQPVGATIKGVRRARARPRVEDGGAGHRPAEQRHEDIAGCM